MLTKLQTLVPFCTDRNVQYFETISDLLHQATSVARSRKCKILTFIYLISILFDIKIKNAHSSFTLDYDPIKLFYAQHLSVMVTLLFNISVTSFEIEKLTTFNSLSTKAGGAIYYCDSRECKSINVSFKLLQKLYQSVSIKLPGSFNLVRMQNNLNYIKLYYQFYSNYEALFYAQQRFLKITSSCISLSMKRLIIFHPNDAFKYFLHIVVSNITMFSCIPLRG